MEKIVEGRHAGRTALVTGAAKGLGLAHAERLAREGARVIVADLEPGPGQHKPEKFDSGDLYAIAVDVADPDSVAALATEVADLGGVDILVNNAGIYPFSGIDEMPYEQWKRVLAVNLDSNFLLTKAVLPHMRAQSWGRIICTSSGMFHVGTPGAAHYTASKGGVIGFVRALAGELGPSGITINAIAPGLVRTEGTSTGFHDEIGMFDMIREMQAIKRTEQPDDVAKVVSFLASDESEFVTGQTLLVDGGIARG